MPARLNAFIKFHQKTITVFARNDAISSRQETGNKWVTTCLSPEVTPYYLLPKNQRQARRTTAKGKRRIFHCQLNSLPPEKETSGAKEGRPPGLATFPLLTQGRAAGTVRARPAWLAG
jgi:hypothetical protein